MTNRSEELSADRVRRAVFAGSLGNLVEWYEFALFGAFATTIAATFFPNADSGQGLLAVFGTFGLGFVARPAGAFLFGHLGDRIGRRHVLVVTLVLMAAGTAGIGLLPSHDRIGVAAPILVVVLRSLQGVAIGGEFGGSAALVIEGVPREHRGWYGGWHWASNGAGVAIGLAAAALVGAIPPSMPLYDLAWRVPFLAAVPLAVGGLVVRSRVEESAPFRALRQRDGIAPQPVREAMRDTRPQVLVGFAAVAAVSVTFNLVYVFLPNHLAMEGRLELPEALGAAFLGPLVTMITAPGFGRLSDRVGRRMVVLGGLAALVVAVPLGVRLVLTGSQPWTFVGFAMVGIPLGSLSLTAFLAELFPTRLRHSGISLSYGLSSAMLGGTTPAVASLLAGGGRGLTLPVVYAVAVVGVAYATAARLPGTGPLREVIPPDLVHPG